MIRVEKSVADAEPCAADDLLSSLDDRPGVWLGCDVEAEGLYRRESMGCVGPALGFFLDGAELRVLAFTPAGHALLEHLGPLAEFVPCEGGLVARFGGARQSPHPVIGVLRAFLALFQPVAPELGLYGVFSFDYYRLAGDGAIPDDGRRRLALFFPERVLVSKAQNAQWIEFRFPELRISEDARAAAVPTAQLDASVADLPAGSHAEAVARGVEKLRRGELFSLVLSQTFRRPVKARASAAFRQLRESNPYPAMFYLNLGGGEKLFGASPDLQVRADGQWVESAPVCGTYRRGTDPVGDLDQALALLNSDKEDASLAACADSDCNDKAAVCTPGSIEVVSHRRAHFFTTIIHTIAHTRGRRAAGIDAFDILLAHSTPATVTGLPKPAAIAAIDELESSPRGWYAGAVARLGSDGSVDVLTVLRAARVVGNTAEVRTGGNLLVDSDPDKEEEETRLKAETLFRVLAGASPKVPAPSVDSHRRFRVAFRDCGDPMGPLLRECLAGAGCELVSESDCEVIVLGGGAMGAFGDSSSPVLAIGESALQMLERDGANVRALAEPKYARRVAARPIDGGFLAGSGPWDLGLYSRQAVDAHSLPVVWRAVLASSEGWILAAEHEYRPQIAVMCRPDSIQSAKNDAGRCLVRASLARLAGRGPVIS